MRQIDLTVGDTYALKTHYNPVKAIYQGVEKKGTKRYTWQAERLVSHAQVVVDGKTRLVPFKDILHPWSVEEGLIQEREERNAIHRRNLAIATEVTAHLNSLGLDLRPSYGGGGIIIDSFKLEKFAEILGVDLKGI